MNRQNIMPPTGNVGFCPFRTTLITYQTIRIHKKFDFLNPFHSQLKDNTWTHLALVYDGAEVRLYKDAFQIAKMDLDGWFAHLA